MNNYPRNLYAWITNRSIDLSHIVAIIVAVTCLQFFPVAVHAQTVEIAPMTWTERSDWVNVKTDAALTVHAVGDGVTDDTAAIQAALDLVSASSEKSVVYLPAGTYRITDTLYWTTGQWCIAGRSLYGCGSLTTVIWDGVADGIMFLSTGNSKARYYGVQWDGNHIAATGMYFEPRFLANPTQGIAEAPMLHYNQAFMNFTGVALDFRNRSHTEWTGEVEVRNCLFYNNEFGSQIGRDYYNNYEYIFDLCHFENCGTGIDSAKNAALMVFNTRFDGSTVSDLTGEQSIRARHCISTGSKHFLKVPEYFGGGGHHVIQDCWIDSWTNPGTGFYGGVIRFDKRSQSLVFDCKFTNAPNSEQPINLVNKSFDTPNNVMVSNNVAAGFTTQLSMVNSGTGGGPANILPIEAAPASSTVGVTTILENPNYVFLDSTPIVDSTNILDVTQAPYFADRTNTADASVAIQAAIDDAIAANNGSIVYLPTGKYRIDTTFSVTGGNYSIEGSGYRTQFIWNGSETGVIFDVDTPKDIALRYFQFKVPESKIETVGVYATASTPAKFKMRGVYHRMFYGNNIDSIGSAAPYPGIVLDGLPEGSFVYLNTIAAAGLNLHNCGDADILGQNAFCGKIIIDGVDHNSRGFTGFTYLNSGVIAGIAYLSDADGFDINVKDNQSFIVGDYYNEQTGHNLLLSNDSNNDFGRVTFQGFRRESKDDNIAISVDNYIGRLFYGFQSFENRDGSVYLPTKIEHVGSNPFDLVLVMDSFNFAPPIFSLGAGANLISQYNKTSNLPSETPRTSTLLQNVPATVTLAEEQAIRAGLDHLQELGLHQLKYNAGLEPALSFSWRDDFSSISGTEALDFSGINGDFRMGTLSPQSGPSDYFFWYSGGTNFDLRFAMDFNAVGNKPGLVFENTTGAGITTNFAGYTSDSINIAEVMNWEVGQITYDQVKALIVLFDYEMSGFTHMMSFGLSASHGAAGIVCLDALPATQSPQTSQFEMKYINSADIQTMIDHLNANGGVLKLTTRIPSGPANAGARLAIADIDITLPYYWFDDLEQASGSGGDVLNLQGGVGGFANSTMQPQGSFHDYQFYYQGNTAFDWSLQATASAIGNSAGLVLKNNLGATVNTSFGGISIKTINVASVMGWKVGEITAADVAALSLSFNYELSGFSNMLSLGLTASDGSNSIMVLHAYANTTNPTAVISNMSTASQAQRENMAQILNGNGGNLNITTLLPSGLAVAGAELRLADIVVLDPTHF